MKFSARQDLDVPVEALFDRLTDADFIQRSALHRGVRLERKGAGPVIAQGDGWASDVTFRGKKRRIEAEMTEVARPEGLTIAARVGGIEAMTVLDFIALSPEKTRTMIALTLKPKTLTARLLLQAMRLTKGASDRRFKTRFSDTMLGLAAKLD